MRRRGVAFNSRQKYFPSIFIVVLLLFVGYLIGLCSSVLFYSTQTSEIEKDSTHCAIPPIPSPNYNFNISIPNSLSLIEGEREKGENETGDYCITSTVAKYTQYTAEVLNITKIRNKKGPMRIAAFSRLWIPPLHSTGGMQFHAFHIYSQLAARGHFIHVFVTGPANGKLRKLYYCVDSISGKTNICNNDNNNKAPLVVEQVASSHDKTYSVKWLENCLEIFKQYHQKNPFHVIHSESWAGVPNIYQMGLPFAVTWHGSMFDWFRNELNYVVHNYRMKHKMPGKGVIDRMRNLASSIPIEQFMLLTIPQHIVISDIASKELQEIHHISKDRIKLIYNGVNRHMFQPRDEENSIRHKFLLKYNIPREHYIVGCGGRLEAIKGHLQLSNAMRLIMQQYKDITLLVAGHGTQEILYKNMQNEGFHVILLGMLSQTDLVQFYQTIDVFIDPFYQHHGLNTVMIEAALSEVPLIVANLGGARSVVPCNEYGRIFTLGDINGLVKEILYYKLFPKHAKSAARLARERALHLFTSDIMASQYEIVLYNIIDKSTSLYVENITGKLVCTTVYPAMCYRELE